MFWALSNIDKKTDWILRIDADEYLSDKLSNEINEKIPKIENYINGIYIPRRIKFQGKLIKHGGVFPLKIIRMFRFGYGYCDNRLMDEKFIFEGKSIELKNELIDNNLKSFSWWLEKHNRYANKEVVNYLTRNLNS